MPTGVKIIFLQTRSSKEDMKEASATITKTIGTKWGKIFITQRKCCYIFSTRIISESG